MGGWPADPRLREIGQWAQYTLEEDLEGKWILNQWYFSHAQLLSNHCVTLGYVMFMWNTVLERSLDEMRVFLMSYRKELRNKGIHAYLPQRIVYARKPESP